MCVKDLNRSFGFEAFSNPEGVLKRLNARTGGAFRFRIRQMPWYLRIDVLHPKQLVIYKLQHGLQFLEGELNSYFFHPDETILPRLMDGPRNACRQSPDSVPNRTRSRRVFPRGCDTRRYPPRVGG